MLLISAILLGKEIINTGLRYGQNLFGEKIRVNVSSRLSQVAVERILTYRLAFYTDSDNQTGILQTRIDRGAESLTKLVQSAFIDILPLFANAILALVIMFLANVYVGLVAAAIMPVYFLLSQRQASMLKGARRGLARPARGEEQRASQHHRVHRRHQVVRARGVREGEAAPPAAEPGRRAVEAAADQLRLRRAEDLCRADRRRADHHPDGLPRPRRADVDRRDHVSHHALRQRLRAHPPAAPHLRRDERRPDLRRRLLSNPRRRRSGRSRAANSTCHTSKAPSS